MWRWLCVLLCLQISIANAQELEIKMLAQGSALIGIDGKQRMLRAGATSPEGVKLVSADRSKAVVEINGERQTLTLSRRISTRFNVAEKKEIRISSGGGGHFFAEGQINGLPVKFVVDTGATSVSMNRLEAERLGINYLQGIPVMVSTANGTVKKYRVMLERVAVGDLEMRQVDGIVSTTESPEIILLGNSYLSSMEMTIDQGVLLLRKKH